MTITGFLNRVAALDADKAIDDAIEQTKARVVALNRGQLERGLTKEGQRIGRYKNPAYAAKKYAQSPFAGYGNIDLKLTGDFVREMFVDQRFDALIIGSTDSKTQDLLSRYPKVFGLTKESIKTYRKAVRPVLIHHVKKQLTNAR